MSNWISGCHIKQYHQPLTTNMLKRVHAAKEQQQQAMTSKQQTIAKAKACECKCKNQEVNLPVKLV